MGNKNRKPTNSPTPVAPTKASPPPPEPQPSLHGFFAPQDWIAAVFTFLVSGLAFLYFMSPEVTLEDSGELVTGAFNFGVPHPPGYPLWALLGWVWRHLVPIGNPAYRICLMSVLTGALVVGVLTLLMTRSIMMLLRSVTWAKDIEDPLKHWMALTIGPAVALMFGFNRGVWLWACVPEMRALNLFMFIITACTFFAWMMRPQRYGFLYATILCYALGLCVHQTIVVMAAAFIPGAFAFGLLSVWDRRPWHTSVLMPALTAFWELTVAALLGLAASAYVDAWLQTGSNGDVLAQKVNMFILFGPPIPATALIFMPAALGVLLLVWMGNEGWLSRKRALICTAAFIVGCSCYFYMSVSSSTNPPMNWGYAYTKQGFLHTFTRGQYERLNLSPPWRKEFWIQTGLFGHALLQQFSLPLGFDKDYLLGLPIVLLAFGTLAMLIGWWKDLHGRARAWLIFVWLSFLTTGFVLLMIINPGVDKQNQEINIKFFAPAHGFFTMMFGYGLSLGAAWAMFRWKDFPQSVMRFLCAACLLLPLISFARNRGTCDMRGHDFGYQFGYRMFRPLGGYPDMDKDAVLYGGTDPGRFVPTYMIFCESRVPPGDRYRDPHFDSEGSPNFDRRDVYIITQNALADSTYMSYIRDHYDFSRPDPNNPQTLERRRPWQQAVFKWGWTHLHRDTMYPKEPIWIPSELDTQRAFQEYINNVQSRQAHGEQLSSDENVTVEGGAVQVRGVAGVMNINGILTKWIFDHAKDKHSFYVEESYVIPWMYPYLTPAGIIMKINHDPLPSPQENPKLWQDIVDRDKAYWNKLCDEMNARPQFHHDSDAQKTFSKLRSAIGGLYASRQMAVEAEYAFKQALQLCPESPEANFRLAQLYMELGRTEDALATLEALQKLDPLNDKITGAIDQIKGIKQSRQDVPQLEAAYSNNPHDFGLLGQLAQAYIKAGQKERVSLLLNNYLAQKDIPPDAFLQAAQAFWNLGLRDSALNALQAMTQRFPQDARGYYFLAMMNAMQNNAAVALPMLEKAFSMAPQLRQQAANEPQFNSLHNNPDFQRLLGSP
jgi:tetratricopeptide (TPR) repeat protein